MAEQKSSTTRTLGWLLMPRRAHGRENLRSEFATENQADEQLDSPAGEPFPRLCSNSDHRRDRESVRLEPTTVAMSRQPESTLKQRPVLRLNTDVVDARRPISLCPLPDGRNHEVRLNATTVLTAQQRGFFRDLGNALPEGNREDALRKLSEPAVNGEYSLKSRRIVRFEESVVVIGEKDELPLKEPSRP